jgi:hypothetical protein
VQADSNDRSQDSDRAHNGGRFAPKSQTETQRAGEGSIDRAAQTGAALGGRGDRNDLHRAHDSCVSAWIQRGLTQCLACRHNAGPWASSARTLRKMNRRQPSQANGFRFRRARRLFFCVAPGPGHGNGPATGRPNLWASRRDDINIAGF